MSAKALFGKVIQEGRLFLPSEANEVDAVLVFVGDGSTSPAVEQFTLGTLSEDSLSQLPEFFVRLGTQVSDAVTSRIGFRVFVREYTKSSLLSGDLESNYSVASFEFLPNSNKLEFGRASEKESINLESLKLLKPESRTSHDNATPLCYLNIISDAQLTALRLTEHGRPGGPGHVDKSLNKELILKTKWAKLFFFANVILQTKLDAAVKIRLSDNKVPSWNASLPESALPNWPFNVQTSMVAGSIDVLNLLVGPSKYKQISNGPSTSLKSRPQAMEFKQFIHSSFPNIQPESTDKVYPLLLNVACGRCVNLPFGLSMLNQPNFQAGIKFLRVLLDAGFDAAEIGFVTFYPAQAKLYEYHLQECHNGNHTLGYNKVSARNLEDWVDREARFIIVDFVRTATAGGNLGHLSQARRLQLALSLHHDGLIVIGDVECTKNSHREIISKKLDSLFTWFKSHGRVLNVSHSGDPLPIAQQPGQTSIASEVQEAVPSEANLDYQPQVSNNAVTPRYVGIPELDQRMQAKAVTEAVSNRKARSTIAPSSTTESFARQGLVAGAVDPRPTGACGMRPISRSLAQHPVAQTSTDRARLTQRWAMGVPKAEDEDEDDDKVFDAAYQNLTLAPSKIMGPPICVLPRYPVKLRYMHAMPHGDEKNARWGSSKKQSIANSLLTQSSSHFLSPSAQRTIPQHDSDLGDPSFQSHYRGRYKAIRDVFNSSRNSTPPSDTENELFRRLADCCFNEDVSAFEVVYAELLELASKTLTRKSHN